MVSPPSAIQCIPEVYSSWVKWPKTESDRSYLGSAEVRNMRNIWVESRPLVCVLLEWMLLLCQTAVRLGDPVVKVLPGLRLILSSIFTETRTVLSTIIFSRNSFPPSPSIAQETRKLKWKWTFQFSEISGVSWNAERWFASREWLCSMEFVSKVK